MPDVSDLPEFMQEAEFKRRYGGVGGAGYSKVMADDRGARRARPLLRYAGVDPPAGRPSRFRTALAVEQTHSADEMCANAGVAGRLGCIGRPDGLSS